jgi:hypothetical protein
MTIESDDLREFYFSADPDVNEVDTVELRHPLFVDEFGTVVAVRAVNRREDFTARLEAGAPMNGGELVTFQAAGFKPQRPESSDQGMPTFLLVVANGSHALIPYLDLAVESSDPLYMTFRAYLSDDPSGPQFIIDQMSARNVAAGVFELTASAGFEDFLNSPFGRRLYTTRDHPGLDR